MLSKEKLLEEGWCVRVEGLPEDDFHKLYQAVRFNPLFSRYGVERLYYDYNYIGLGEDALTISFLNASTDYGRDALQLSYGEYFEIFEDTKKSIEVEKAESLEDINFLVVQALLLPDSLSKEERIELAKQVCSLRQPTTMVNNIITGIDEGICTEGVTPLHPPHRTTSG